jgi:hypothetical protein
MMSREEAIEVAKRRHRARCAALRSAWMIDPRLEPRDEDYGYRHGWFNIYGHSIGAHEYAPGPTYDGD